MKNSIQSLKDRESAVRRSAAEALARGNLGEHAKAAVPALKLAADFQVKIFVLSLWFCGGPKYQNIVKVSKYQIVVKVSKYWLYQSRILAPGRNF